MNKADIEKVYKDFILNNENESIVSFGYKLFNKRLQCCDFLTVDKPDNNLYIKSKEENIISIDDVIPFKMYNINNTGDYNLKDFDRKKTINKLKLLDNIVFINDDANYWIISTDGWIIDCEYGLGIFSEDGKVPSIIYDNIVFKPIKPTFSICYMTDSGIKLINSNIKEVSWDSIKNNYNTDLPLDKINNFIISEESSGLSLFHGIPGTGKTYFIRYLISKYSNKKFVYIDYNDFYKLCDAKYFLNDLKNTVLIIEDCEGLLKSRDSNDFSYTISSLLNITDGLLSDSVNIKVICTFNTNLKNLDRALTRNGRLKINYEFKELSKDIANKKKEELNSKTSSNLLCDIYNPDTVNPQIKNKIGF